MKEKGFVVNLKGDMAVVRIQRQTVSCGNCSNCNTVNNVLIEAQNLCGAHVNDWVYIESDEDKRNMQILVRIGACIFTFVIGIAVGDYVIGTIIGINKGRELAAFFSGIAMALGVYFAIKLKNKGASVSLPVVSEIVNNP